MSLVKTILFGRPNGLRAKLMGRDQKSPPPSAPQAPPARPAPEPAEKALGLAKEAPKDVNPPDGFEVVLHREALTDGQIIEVIIGGTAIAVARVGNEHYAIANTCAHAGGPLGDGKLQGHLVTCPYHGWKYDIRDGACQTTPGVAVKKFEVRTVGDAVCVQL